MSKSYNLSWDFVTIIGISFRRFAHVAGSLYKLTKRDKPYVWDPKCQESFESLIAAFVHDCVLIQPDQGKKGQFQAFMNSIFSDLIDRGVLVYIDDLLLYSPTKDDHDKLLVEVFNRLRANNLKVNPKKCLF